MAEDAFIIAQAPATPADYPSLDIILDFTRDQLAAQHSYASALDSKAGFVLGSASLLSGLLVAWRPPQSDVQYPLALQALVEALPGFVTALPLVVIGIYLFVIATAYRAYSLHSYKDVPNPKVLYPEYLKTDEFSTKGTVLATMVSAYNSNERTLKGKVFWTRAALLALLVEALVVAVMLGIEFLH